MTLGKLKDPEVACFCRFYASWTFQFVIKILNLVDLNNKQEVGKLSPVEFYGRFHEEATLIASAQVVRLLSLWQNAWDNQLIKRKNLFCFMAPELSIHGHWDLLWGRTSWQGKHGEAQLLPSGWPGNRQRSEYLLQMHISNDWTSIL
jgi:hypothetical protein